jgi:DNA repair exonuclease SbcCD ATPase subunit
VFDFFVNFNLDESFNEVIKSRGRDEFSYASFSEGEKAKINISVLFAFRQVAAMKNSVRTNLLIMDEAFDSSLDLESVESLTEILTELSSTNLFVVSHRGMEHFDKFEKIIEIRKKGDFSSIEYTK